MCSLISGPTCVELGKQIFFSSTLAGGDSWSQEDSLPCPVYGGASVLLAREEEGEEGGGKEGRLVRGGRGHGLQRWGLVRQASGERNL